MAPVTYLLGPDTERTDSVEAPHPIVQQFEISDPIAKACWYKDGTQIYPKSELDSESQSCRETLLLHSDGLSGDEGFGCGTTGGVDLNVDVKGGVPHCTCTIKNELFSYIPEDITQLIVFSLALSEQQNSVTLVTRVVMHLRNTLWMSKVI